MIVYIWALYVLRKPKYIQNNNLYILHVFGLLSFLQAAHSDNVFEHQYFYALYGFGQLIILLFDVCEFMWSPW